MYKNIFDSHAHYDDERFNEDRYDVLERLFKSGVCGIVNCGSDLKTSITSINLSAKYPLGCTAGEAVNNASRSVLFQKTHSVFMRFTVMYYYGLLKLVCHYQLFFKSVKLNFSRRKVIVVIEPDFAHGR